ncbi:hypothetical protein [uncultured Fibrobacter sp.]|uniref:hypothetical protein n=1 Tax=uncultured Fibrobacter sp. TaxID=261512 RepID=UPI0025DF41BE|nr:hypothetical protein [uncultured Fibrobacter sp.]MBR2470097.1 hypothetical protein [Fibrobacter sp.]
MKDKILKSEDLKEPWVEAFKVGKVTDMAGKEHEFSESDLNDLNEGIHNQLDAGYQPPMVKGHPQLDDPRVASIVDSKVEDNVLKVKLDDVNPDFAEEVKKGGFKYLSAAIYSNLKKGLRHLGALGAHAPAMKGMAPLCFGEGMFADQDKDATEQDVSVFAEPFAWDRLVPRSVFESLVYKISGIGRMFRSQREQLIEKDGIEAADKVFPEYAIKDIEEVESVLKDAKDFPEQPKPVVEKPAESTASFGEPNEPGPDSPENGKQDPQPTTPPHDEPTASIPEGNSSEAARLSEENAALKAENEALKADKLAAQRQKAEAAFSETLDNAIAEGRCTQIMKDNLMKVFGAMQALPVDGEGCFGEGDERINPMQILDEAVKAMPKIVSFGEFAPASVPGKESAAVRIGKYHDEQLAKGRKLSFAEAAEECYNQ